MKKFLLSLGALVLGLSSYADTALFYVGSAPSGVTATAQTEFINYGTGSTPGGDLNVVNDEAVFTAGDIQITFTRNNSSYSQVNGTQLRWYQSDVMNIKPLNGTNITNVTIYAPGYIKDVTSNVGTPGTNTSNNTVFWNGDATQTLELTTTAQIRFSYLTVTYGEDAGEVPPTPSVPNAPEGIITVSAALDLLKQGYEGDATVKGIITQIDEISTQYGNATYYIADTAEAEEVLEVYRGYSLNGDKFTSGNEIAVGGTVTVSGKLVDYNGTYEFTSGSKILDYQAPEGGSEGGDEGGNGEDDQPLSTEITSVIKNLKAGDSLDAVAVVTAQNARGLILTDNAGSILYYNQNVNLENYPIGAIVNVKGTVAAYNNGLQLDNNASLKVAQETSNYTYPQPEIYTGVMMTEASTIENSILATYVTIEGQLNVSGNYYNVIVEGTELQGSLVYPTEALKNQLTSGNSYKITGYYTYINGSATKYFNVVVTSFELVAEGGGNEGGGDETPDTPNIPVAPAPEGSPVTFNFINYTYGVEGQYPGQMEQYKDNAIIQNVPIEITYGDVKLVLNGTEDKNNYRFWSDGLRFYNLGEPYFTVSTTNGKNITYIGWEGVSGFTLALPDAEENITEWTGNAASVTLKYTADKNYALSELVVAYGEAYTPEEPNTPEAPKGVITVAEALELIEDGYRGPATVKGVVTEVGTFYESYGQIDYTISDEGQKNALFVYNGKGLNGVDFKAATDVVVGAIVEVKGDLTLYNATPEFARGSQLVSYTPPTGSGDDNNGDDNNGDDNNGDGEFTGETAMFDFSNLSSLKATLDGQQVTFPGDEGEYDVTNVVFSSGAVTVTGTATEDATNNPRLFLGTGNNATWTYRFYNNNTVTIAVPEGYSIEGIEFVATNLGNQSIVFTGEGSFSNNVWTANEGATVTEVVINKTSTGNNPAITSMTVYYNAPENGGDDNNGGNTGGDDNNGDDNNGDNEGEGGDNSGVGSISSDDAPVEYFNLNGQKVAHPQGGIFIRRQGENVSKVVIR